MLRGKEKKTMKFFERIFHTYEKEREETAEEVVRKGEGDEVGSRPSPISLSHNTKEKRKEK